LRMSPTRSVAEEIHLLTRDGRAVGGMLPRP
jgi:hypothetical protein